MPEKYNRNQLKQYVFGEVFRGFKRQPVNRQLAITKRASISRSICPEAKATARCNACFDTVCAALVKLRAAICQHPLRISQCWIKTTTNLA